MKYHLKYQDLLGKFDLAPEFFVASTTNGFALPYLFDAQLYIIAMDIHFNETAVN